MKKFLLSVFATLLMAMPMFASKANSEPFTVKQSDGTELTVVLHGDEHFHWYSTLDGVILARAGGQFFVAQIANDGAIVATEQLAHNAQQRSESEASLAAKQDLTLFNTPKAVARREAMRVQQTGRAGFNYFPHKGSPTAVVILAQFSDTEFYLPDPVKSFEQYFNGDIQNDFGNGENRNHGSVKKYFTDMSDGQFTPNFKIVGPVTLPKSMEYYGANSTGGSKDVNYRQFVKDACAEASKQQSFDNAEFDSDKDGCVDLVAIIFAGFGENNDPTNENTLWAKTSLQDFGSYNGKSVKTAMMISELNAKKSLLGSGGSYSTPQINGVGVFCHEMSHTMGLPDFYSTTSPANKKDNQELEYWSIMDGGENVNNGYCPTAYTAFERKHMGWRDYVEMEDGKTYSLKTADNGELGHVYYNPNTLATGRVADYFVFENVQNKGWNSGLPGHGLIAYRVSLRNNNMQYNTPINNIVGDPGFTLVPADGCVLNSSNTKSFSAYKNSMAADPFPGTLKVTTLLATQNLPNFAWRDAPMDNKMGLYNIVEDTESTHEVSFHFVADVTTSGLQNVVTDATSSADNRIFSIDGICLGTNLSVLPKGLYIIGGKKVVKQ